jgi:hypothetical protein
MVERQGRQSPGQVIMAHRLHQQVIPFFRDVPYAKPKRRPEKEKRP